MSYDFSLRLENVGKIYSIYNKPSDRLLQFFSSKKEKYGRKHIALEPVSIEIKKGEVLGVIGTNGSGKSTLMQLICGVLEPSSGRVQTNGRIAALLELGAGFNPDFTGRENIFLNAAILGLSHQEINKKIDEIIKFSGVEKFIDQPVKTYSSGMYVRLAFSVATSVDPDILVIDEALSVGDGAFARKSFDRIMSLKQKGCTIVFCSHSIYQVEALCQRVLWLDKGKLQAFGEAAFVCQRYNQYLEGISNANPLDGEDEIKKNENLKEEKLLDGSAKISNVKISVDKNYSPPYIVQSMHSELCIEVEYKSSITIPAPTVAIVITDFSGKNITSCSTYYDNVDVSRDTQGTGVVKVSFPRVHLLRGIYVINVLLMCEQAIHIYEHVRCTEFSVEQKGLEVGIVALQREWE